MYGGMNLLFNVQSTLVQRCKHVTVVSTLWRRCETDAAIPMVQRRCQCKIHGISWAELNMQCWGNVRATLYIWGCSIKVVQTLWNWCLDSNGEQCYQYNMYRILWAEITLQCCRSICSLLQFEHCDINVATTLYIGSATLQSYHNIASPLCFCWNVFSLSTL